MKPLLLKDLSEAQLIAKIIDGRVPTSKDVVVDNGDDAAVWRVAEADTLMVASTDSLVEGVHYHHLNEATGRKLMAVNLSDLASMGAHSQYALLSLHLSEEVWLEAVQAMARGLHARAHEFNIQLIGGNVTRTSGPAVLSLTLLGYTKAPVCRTGASTGEGLFVTGTLGDARAGLEVEDGDLFAAQVDPVPRVRAGRDLAEARCVSSMCDISDGLAKDLRHLLGAQGLGARLHESSLPISPALFEYAGERACDYAVFGGEDYELLFTASDEDEVRRVCTQSGTPVSRIGVLISKPSFELVDDSGKARTLEGGFDHFGQNLS